MLVNSVLPKTIIVKRHKVIERYRDRVRRRADNLALDFCKRQITGLCQNQL